MTGWSWCTACLSSACQRGCCPSLLHSGSRPAEGHRQHGPEGADEGGEGVKEGGKEGGREGGGESGRRKGKEGWVGEKEREGVREMIWAASRDV